MSRTLRKFAAARLVLPRRQLPDELGAPRLADGPVLLGVQSRQRSGPLHRLDRLYGAQLEGQSITLDSSTTGTYCLVETADPLNHIAESNESNNRVGIQITISGTTVTTGGPC